MWFCLQKHCFYYFKKATVMFCILTRCHVGFQWVKSQQKSLFFLFLDKGQVLLHIIWWAHHKGCPLVQWLGNNIQDTLGACRGDASGLLDQEGYGVTLVQQPQLENMKHMREKKESNRSYIMLINPQTNLFFKGSKSWTLLLVLPLSLKTICFIFSYQFGSLSMLLSSFRMDSF